MANRHTNPTYNDREALAPYNFVRLPDAVRTLPEAALPRHDVIDPARHSGLFECELTTCLL